VFRWLMRSTPAHNAPQMWRVVGRIHMMQSARKILLIAVALAAGSLGPASASDLGASAQGAISSYRKQHGLPGVSVDPALMQLAHQQAAAMARANTMSHSVGGSFASRLGGANRSIAAENIAMGTKDLSSTLTMWKHSSGHNANLLKRGVSRIGVASANGGGRTYWALILAGSVERRPALTMVGRRRAAGPRTLPEW
jgi:uncharacterized protein YkwD